MSFRDMLALIFVKYLREVIILFIFIIFLIVIAVDEIQDRIRERKRNNRE